MPIKKTLSDVRLDGEYRRQLSNQVIKKRTRNSSQHSASVWRCDGSSQYLRSFVDESDLFLTKIVSRLSGSALRSYEATKQGD